MLMLGLLSKLMMVAGLTGFIYGLVTSKKLTKVISLVVLGSGFVFWVVKSATNITFLLVTLALIIGWIAYTLNKPANNADGES